MTWYLNYDFSENPFSIKANISLVGVKRKEEQLIDYIKGGDVCFLNGPTGTGKSSLLKRIKANLKGHKVIYIDAAEVGKGFKISNLLKKHRKFLDILKRKEFPDNVVVLVDESQECSEDFIKALKLHWDHNHIKSIVVTQISPELGDYSKSFRDRIGNRIIKLGGIKRKAAFDLIKMRTSDRKIFEDRALEKVFEFADYNPRKILETCEIIAIKLKHKNSKLIDVSDVEKILGKLKSLAKAKKEAVKPVEKVEVPEYIKTFSPMQQNIIKFLAESSKTAKQLASLLNTSEGSVGKQLSKLSQLDVVKVVNNKRPKLYGLVKE